MATVETPSGNPVLASILSLIVPGMGQIYSKRVLSGTVWFGAGVVLWFGALGWIVHILSAVFAYRYANSHF